MTVRWTQRGELAKPECQKAQTFFSLVTGRYSWSEDTISSSDLLSRRDSGITLSPGLTGQDSNAEVVVGCIAVAFNGLLAVTGDDSDDLAAIVTL